MIVGAGITPHFVNQANTLILSYLFTDGPFPTYFKKYGDRVLKFSLLKERFC
jgi:hypothetical protein